MSIIRAYTSAVIKAYVRAVIPGSVLNQITKIILLQNSDIVWTGGAISTIPSGYGNANYRHFNIGNLYKVRQNGAFDTITLAIDNAPPGTVYFEVWRKNGTLYDKVHSEDIYAKIVEKTTCTITLNHPVEMLEGDFFGLCPAVSGTGSFFPYFTESYNGSHRRTAYNTSVPDTGADLDSYDNSLQPNLIKLSGIAPVIVGIGHSIIAGHPLHYSGVENGIVYSPSSSITYQLALLDSKYIYQNMGVGSETSTQILARFTNHCINLKPKIALIDAAWNDIQTGVTKATFIANMTSMLNACQSANIVPVVFKELPATNQSNTNMQTRDAWMVDLRDLVETYTGAIYIDFDSDLGQFRAGGDDGNLWDLIPAYNADGIHPTTAAYTKMAEIIDSAIKSIYTIQLAPDTYFKIKSNTISETQIDIELINGNSGTEDSISWEYSTDGVNFTEKGTTLSGVNTYSMTGLTANTLYYFRTRTLKGAIYSSYTSIISDYSYYALTLTATGTGAGVSLMKFITSSNQILRVTGSAKFYSDALGTLDEKEYAYLITGTLRTFFLKCATGAASLLIKPAYITSWGNRNDQGYYGSTNCPTLEGDVSKFINATVLHLFVGNAMSGSITGLTKLTTLKIQGTNTISGDIAGLTDLNYALLSGDNTINGSITGLTKLTYLDGDGKSTLSGSVSALVDLTTLKLNLSSKALNTVNGSLAGLTKLVYLFVQQNNEITYSTHAWAASMVYFLVYCKTGSWWSVTDISQAVIDADATSWTSPKTLDFANAQNTMADTNQGGIWGYFDGETTPSTLAISYKSLKRTKTVTVNLKGITAPVATGDGTGFPAGFGNWWRS